MTVADPRIRIAGGNPFIGLRPFGPADAELFFGREAHVAKLLQRLRNTRFLATVGASGCGKSSLVLAGLIPALQLGAIEGAGAMWRIAALRPGAAPVEALAAVLARSQVLGERADDPNRPRAEILRTLRRSDLGLVDVVVRANLRGGENVLVVVDQFEELFRYASGGDPVERAREAAAFVRLLLTAASQQTSPIYVAISMRSDYVGECAQFSGLAEAVNDGMFLVPRLTRDELRRSIAEPVSYRAQTIAPQLVARLLDDVGTDADQLPVLEHALMRTWDAWDGDHSAADPLDVRHYESIGAMSGALSKHANDLYDRLLPRQRQIAERLFRCLTARDRENRGVRRPTSFRTACAVTGAQSDELANLLRMYAAPGVSFLTASAPLSNPEAILDISHESLTRLWDRLRAWIDDEADSAKTYRKLAHDAAAGRAYWTGAELAVAEAWRKTNRASINAEWAIRYDDPRLVEAGDDSARSHAAHQRFTAALAFLAASAAAPRRRLRSIAAAVGVFFIIAAALAIFGFAKSSEATAERRRVEDLNKTTVALQRAKALQAQRLDATIARSAQIKRVADAQIEQAKLSTAGADKRVRDAEALVKTNAEKSRQAEAQVTAQLARARALATYNGGIAHARDNPAAAVAAYDSALNGLGNGVGTAADLAAVYYARGAAYAAQRKNGLAVADYDRALQLQPAFKDAATAKQFALSGSATPPPARTVAATAAPARTASAPAVAAAPARSAAPATPIPLPNAAAATTAECSRALRQQQLAANAAPGEAAYDASVAGLAENARCDDSVTRVVNEGYLRSTRAAAEHAMNMGDWRADLKRANELLAQCSAMPALHGTKTAADCAAQRQFNERAAADFALPSPPPPAVRN